MPASKVMPEFESGELHSGSKEGPIVTSKKQAKAILLSTLRKEGKIQPRKTVRKSTGRKLIPK